MDSIIKKIMDFKKADIPTCEPYLMMGGGTPGVNLRNLRKTALFLCGATIPSVSSVFRFSLYSRYRGAGSVMAMMVCPEMVHLVQEAIC
ncbi:MAG: hypothetical protein R6U35_05130, partial [Candidatus Humimicrobiaceae bacterium]